MFYSGTQPFFLPQISLLPSHIFGLVLLLKFVIQIVHETWWGNLSVHGVNPNYLFDSIHSYDILDAGMLWKPKKSIKFVKIRAKECFDKVLNEEF